VNDLSDISFGQADVGELKLHYATAGSGERLVVLLHGFPEFWYSWRFQIKGLSDTYTVVAPDLRGNNLSDKPGSVAEYAIEHLVADVVGMIRHFDRQDAVVVGHDWGAAIAWSLARRHPELVSKLIALQVPPPDVWKRNITVRQLLASWYMFFFQLPWLPEWIAKRNDFAILERSLRTTAVRGVLTDEDLIVYRQSWRRGDAFSGPINYYRANILGRLLARSSGAEGGKILPPTLFIYGENDHAILPATVKGVGEVVAGPYRHHRIHNCGHWVQQEAADEVTRVIRDFIAE
jgi:pimeloyl-ACP methyl ester carboxylesterase